MTHWCQAPLCKTMSTDLDGRGRVTPPVNSSARSVKSFYPMMIVPGIVLLLAPSTVETIMEQFGFQESMGGLLQVTYFAGGVVGSLLITHMMQRFTTRQIVLSQLLILSVSLLATSLAPWYPLLLLFFVVTGFANGILITFPGVYVTRVCGDASHHQQSLLYGFFALGVVTGPLLSGFLVDNGLSWRWAFAIPALALLPLSIPVVLASLENLEGVKRLSRSVIRQVIGFNRGMFLGLLLAILLYIAAESSMSMWLITFLREEHGISLTAAHWTLTALWIAIMVGRWICGYLSRKVDPYLLLLILCTASGLLLMITPLTDSGTAAIVLYPAVGLFFSGIYPFLIGYVAWFPSDLSSSVFTLFLAAGAAGSTVLPYFVGLVNQFLGLVWGMCSIAIPVLGVLVCVYWVRHHVSVRLSRNEA